MAPANPAAPPVAHGLKPPTVSDALVALRAVFGEQTDEVWRRISRQADVHEHAGHDPESLRRLVTVMRSDTDPVVSLCGQSLSIRIGSYQHLAGIHDRIGGVQ